MATGNPFNLRIPPSGPNVLAKGVSGPDNLAFNVLTVTADGSSVYFAPASGGTVDASDVVNDSLAIGMSVAGALSSFATVPSQVAPLAAGNLTGASNFSLATSTNRTLTLTGNAALTLTGLIPGKAQWFQLEVTQGGAGGFTLSLVGVKTPGGAGLTLSAAPGSVDIISGYWDGTVAKAQVAGLAFA